MSDPPTPTSQWSALTMELLEKILTFLPSFPDHRRFAAVCRSWKIVASKNPPRLHSLPFLTVPPVVRATPATSSLAHAFFYLADNRTYHIDLPSCDPTLWAIIGSSEGWLVLLDTNHLRVRLLNPFSDRHVDLPSLASLGFQYQRCSSMVKACISSPYPDSDRDCIVVLLLRNGLLLAYARIGDAGWSEIEGLPKILIDVLHHEGAFLVVEYLFGGVSKIEFDEEKVVVSKYSEVLVDYHMEGYWLPTKQYLAVLLPEGDLLQVIKMLHLKAQRGAVRFEVLRLVREANRGGASDGSGWRKMESLPRCSLFLGRNSAVTCQWDGDGDVGAFVGGRIFFADDGCFSQQHQRAHNGVYDVKSGRLETLFKIQYYENDDGPPPIWLQPAKALESVPDYGF